MCVMLWKCLASHRVILMAREGASLEYRYTQAGVLNSGQDLHPLSLILGPVGGHSRARKQRQHGSWRPNSN